MFASGSVTAIQGSRARYPIVYIKGESKTSKDKDGQYYTVQSIRGVPLTYEYFDTYFVECWFDKDSFDQAVATGQINPQEDGIYRKFTFNDYPVSVELPFDLGLTLGQWLIENSETVKGSMSIVSEQGFSKKMYSDIPLMVTECNNPKVRFGDIVILRVESKTIIKQRKGLLEQSKEITDGVETFDLWLNGQLNFTYTPTEPAVSRYAVNTMNTNMTKIYKKLEDDGFEINQSLTLAENLGFDWVGVDTFSFTTRGELKNKFAKLDVTIPSYDDMSPEASKWLREYEANILAQKQARQDQKESEE